MTILKDTIRRARKHHACGAWYWFDRSCFGQQDVDADDWLVVEAVREDRGKILPGHEYIYQVSVDGDGFGVFRARIDMHNICLKYNLYPED